MTSHPSGLGRQALKTQITREKIINAVIKLINEGGYSAASSGQISRTAGVTWGAVQHHFGSKDDILDAVVDRSHECFMELMNTELKQGGTLADRVDLFVTLMWQYYQSDEYLAALEILLARRGGRKIGGSTLGRRQQQAHLKTLKRIFPELELSDEQFLDILIFVHILMTGLTIERAFEDPIHNEVKHLRRAKAAMLTMLTT